MSNLKTDVLLNAAEELATLADVAASGDVADLLYFLQVAPGYLRFMTMEIDALLNDSGQRAGRSWRQVTVS